MKCRKNWLMKKDKKKTLPIRKVDHEIIVEWIYYLAFDIPKFWFGAIRVSSLFSATSLYLFSLSVNSSLQFLPGFLSFLSATFFWVSSYSFLNFSSYFDILTMYFSYLTICILLTGFISIPFIHFRYFFISFSILGLGIKSIAVHWWTNKSF